MSNARDNVISNSIKVTKSARYCHKCRHADQRKRGLRPKQLIFYLGSKKIKKTKTNKKNGAGKLGYPYVVPSILYKNQSIEIKDINIRSELLNYWQSGKKLQNTRMGKSFWKESQQFRKKTELASRTTSNYKVFA